MSMSASIDTNAFLERTKMIHSSVCVSDTARVRSIIESLKQVGLHRVHVIADFDMTLTKHWVPQDRQSGSQPRAAYDLTDTGTTRSAEVSAGTGGGTLTSTGTDAEDDTATTGTRQHPEHGQVRNLSSHGVLERGPAVSSAFAAHTAQLASKYYPIEIDASIPIAEKVPLMVQWWEEAHAAMVREGITRDIVRRQAEEADMVYRSGARELLDALVARGVPLLIFSAGIADVIEALLDVSGLKRGNQVVVSNRMEFSSADDGVLVGFAEPLIHVLNKGEHAIHSSPTRGVVICNGTNSTENTTHGSSETLQKTLSERQNIILLGDSIGDSHMADGVPHDAVLKIGYCNFGDEKRVEEFKRHFDVVVTGDASLAWVSELVAFIST